MSSVLDVGVFPSTRVITSMKTRLYAKPFGQWNDRVIGAVSSFSGGGSSRSAEEIRGIGLGDAILDISIGETTLSDIQITRAAFFAENIIQALGFAGGIDGLITTLQGVRYPIDLTQQIVGFKSFDSDHFNRPSLNLTDIDFNKSENATKIRYDDPINEMKLLKYKNKTTVINNDLLSAIPLSGSNKALTGYAAGRNFSSDWGGLNPLSEQVIDYQDTYGGLGSTKMQGFVEAITNRTFAENIRIWGIGINFAVITYRYENCWITNWEKGDYQTGNAMVTENITLKPTRVTNGDDNYLNKLFSSAITFGSQNRI